MHPKYFLPLSLSFLLSLFSCNRYFDEPPQEKEPGLQPTLSIRALKALHQSGRFEQLQGENIISGIIVADDKNGNFYQSVVLQDSTAGIIVRLGDYNLYTRFPQGRKIYIRTKGLYLGDYGGTVQLGAGIDSSLSYRPVLSALAPELFDRYIEKGSFNHAVEPRLVNADQLSTDIQDTLQSTLVYLDNFQFNAPDTVQTLADSSKQSSAVNFILQSCTGQSVILRNSSYASFAALPVPTGNGRITGIFGIYNNDKQLTIRDTSDLAFYNPRCNQQAADTTILTSIKAVRALFKTSAITVPYGTVIKCTVISDSRNEATGNYKLQDASGYGIILYAPAINNLSLNQSYLMDIGGSTLELFSNELELTNLTANRIFLSSPLEILPRRTTIQQLNDSITEWQSTLVQLQGLDISAPTVSNSGRTYTLMDATGSINTFIRSAAGFSLPQGNVPSVTGYLSFSQGRAQLILRNNNDIVSGTTPMPPTATTFSAEYNFTGVSRTSGTTDPTPSPTVNGLTFGAFRAVGLGANPSAAGRFSFTGWPTGAVNGTNDFTGSMAENKYFEFIITPDPQVELSVVRISFSVQRSATGPRQWAIRSSLDNFSSNIPASYSGDKIRITGDDIFQITDRSVTTAQTGCTAEPAATQQPVKSAIIFRIYGFNAESGSGSFSINKLAVEGRLQ